MFKNVMIFGTLKWKSEILSHFVQVLLKDGEFFFQQISINKYMACLY